MPKKRFRDIKKAKIVVEENNRIEDNFYATVRLKIKAFLTDSFMLVMPIMYVVFYLVMDGRAGFEEHMFTGWVYILVPLVFVQTIFMYLTGQTPGYKAYNIALIDEKTKQKPSFLVILFRNISAILSLFTVFGWFLMFFRKDNKTLHDLLSETAVIKIDDKRT